MRGRAAVAAPLAFLLLLAGCSAPLHGPTLVVDGAAPASQTAVSRAPADPSSGGEAPAAATGVAEPAAIAVPRLGIGAVLDPLALDADGALVPPEFGRAGWYADGPEPGEPGPAVIAGHVDTREGPDVFATLAGARRGDRVLVDTVTGQRVVFEVARVERHPKAEFPTARVYGDTAGPELRLITCGGAFDASTGHYVDNVVVYAVLAGRRGRPS